MSKPRLRQVRSHFFGIRGGMVWTCETPESFQIGSTTQDAYNAWAADMPRSAFGRWWRRVINSAVDVFL